MKRHALVILAITLGMQAVAQTNRVMLLESRSDGKTQYYMVSHEVLAKCPKWDAATEPPLAISQAVTRAKEWLKGRFPRCTVHEANSITLEQFAPSLWFYRIEVGRHGPTNIVCRTVTVIVLMDGSVVEPSEKRE